VVVLVFTYQKIGAKRSLTESTTRARQAPKLYHLLAGEHSARAVVRLYYSNSRGVENEEERDGKGFRCFIGFAACSFCGFNGLCG
jgi:hypothetical protein